LLVGNVEDYPAANLCSEKELELCERLQLAPLCYILVKRFLLEEIKTRIPPDSATLAQWVKLDAQRCGTIYDFVLRTCEANKCRSSNKRKKTLNLFF